MTQIPAGWEETTLQLCTLPVQEKISLTQVSEDNYISTENMLPNIWWVVISSGLPNINSITKFQKWDILFSNIRTYFRKLWYATFTGGVSNDVLVFRGNYSKIYSKFLFYRLSDNSFFDYTIKTSKWTKMPRWDKEAIWNFPIHLPPLPEQQAIAAVLSSFDDKIELLRAENETLEQMGQELFKERFGKWKVGDELPEGWRVGKLGEIWIQITQKVKEDSGRVVLSAVNTGNLVLSEEYFSKQVYSNSISKYIVCNKWDFAYNPARINIWSIWRNSYWNGAVSPVYVVFRPKEGFGRFLEYIFKSRKFNDHVAKYSNWSVRQALNYDWFSRFELIIPWNDILVKFNNTLQVFEKKIKRNLEQIQSLSATRDQLLPKLMSWEMRVEF